VLQLELENYSRGAVSASILEKHFHNALRKVGVHPTRFKAQPIGDGCLLVGLWSSGSSFLLWDGHARIDVSMHKADVAGESGRESADDGSALLADAFIESLPFIDVFRSDRIEFPRGIHRALLHPKPDENESPIWV
jgi:hypothetical protein